MTDNSLRAKGAGVSGSEASDALAQDTSYEKREDNRPPWPPQSSAELAWYLTPDGGRVFPPTPEQAAVIEHTEGPLLVVAGAGSGKTRTMAEKVAWVVHSGLAEPHEILGVTFTKKAAAELAHRIRGNLLALQEARARYAPADEHHSGSPRGPHAEHARRETGVSASEESNGLSLDDVDVEVSTYHSYAKRLVSDYGLRLGIEPTAPMLGEAQGFMLARSVVESYGETSATDGHSLDDLQALFGASTPSVTGKVLKLASERAEHGVAWSAIRESLESEIALAQQAICLQPRAKASETLEILQRRLAITRIAESYEQRKREIGQLDFGDLIDLAVTLARDFDDVGATERSRFRFVLLDEFQDTSHNQMELFAELFGPREILQENGELTTIGARSITAVGDPNQSIYGFRGASAGQLAAFLGRFTAGSVEASTMSLNRAWRNPLAVLDAANAIAADLNTVPPFVVAPQVEVKKLAPGVKPAPGRILLGRFAFSTIEIPDALAAIEGLENSTTPEEDDAFAAALRAFPEPRSEATAIADFIESVRGVPDGVAPPSVAVLARTRAALTPIVERLEARGVPCEVAGIGALLEEPEIVELIAYLRVMTDATRSDSMVRILASPKFSIGAADLAALGDWARHSARVARMQRLGRVEESARAESVTSDDARASEAEDIAESASLVLGVEDLPRSADWVSHAGRRFTEEGLARLQEASTLLKQLRRLPADDVVELILDVEKAIGLDVELAAKPGGSPHTARRHIEAFLDEASQFVAANAFVSVGAFLDWIEAAADHENGLKTVELDERHDVVQLMTIHASKGLEWDVVVIPRMEVGTFPSKQTSRWTAESGSMLPYGLRGDADNLPQLRLDPSGGKALEESLGRFVKEAAVSEEREERRLAYVAVTRARYTLWCSASAFTETAANERAVSPYWENVDSIAQQAADEHGADIIRLGGPFPDAGEGGAWKNPLTGIQRRMVWPVDPLGDRRPGFERAQQAVEAAMDALSQEPSSPRSISQAATALGDTMQTDQGKSWAAEAALLINRHERQAQEQARRENMLEIPDVISVSSFVAIADNEQRAAEQLSRPVPRKPSEAARRGTTFHGYLEEHYKRQASFDFDDLWLDSDMGEHGGVSELIEKFASSEWAAREAYDVEVLVETKIAGQRIKGRVDAIFRNADGTWELVDWKTGRIPTGDDLKNKALQLALYRVGWSQITGDPLEKINALFYYVDAGKEVRPRPLPETGELEAMFASRVSDAEAPDL